ncbi:Glucose-6-phosphate 1-dehydrogenase [Rhizophlyctis rosea]|nr:Glucose-6-phosphate 1-dehydrogenase [Rhizophlyctis rosea]
MPSAQPQQKQQQQTPKINHPHVSIVVFGASGDLAKKKTFPALYSLIQHDQLPADRTSFLGTARSEMKDDEFKDKISGKFKVGFYVLISGVMLCDGVLVRVAHLQILPKRMMAYAAELRLEKAPKETLQKFLNICSYVQLKSYTDADSYKNLHKQLSDLESKSKSSSSSSSSVNDNKPLRIFYIALPPSAFEDVSKNIKEHAWTDATVNRVVVEKPYGRDLKSAKELSEVLAKLFEEKDIYRIDHYLGKDTVKSLLPLRFGANPFWEHTWNKDLISHVTINFKEEFGAEGRGGYFDEFGMIRDVMQNHLFQLVIMAGMERPSSLGMEDVHRAKVCFAGVLEGGFVWEFVGGFAARGLVVQKRNPAWTHHSSFNTNFQPPPPSLHKQIDFIKSCRPVKPEHVLIGQYTASANDPKKKAYKDDETVKDDSKASTFATAVLYVDNERWKGVPFVLRAGKALNEDHVSLRIHFKPSPSSLLPSSSTQHPTLTLQDHPTKSTTLTLQTKKPGSTSFTTTYAPLTVGLEKPPIAHEYVPEAYEVLLLDAVVGSKTWFVSREESESGWGVWDGVCRDADGRTPVSYAYGSSGPKEEEEFLRKVVGFGLEGLEGFVGGEGGSEVVGELGVSQ